MERARFYASLSLRKHVLERIIPFNKLSQELSFLTTIPATVTSPPPFFIFYSYPKSQIKI